MSHRVTLTIEEGATTHHLAWDAEQVDIEIERKPPYHVPQPDVVSLRLTGKRVPAEHHAATSQPAPSAPAAPKPLVRHLHRGGIIGASVGYTPPTQDGVGEVEVTPQGPPANDSPLPAGYKVPDRFVRVTQGALTRDDILSINLIALSHPGVYGVRLLPDQTRPGSVGVELCGWDEVIPADVCEAVHKALVARLPNLRVVVATSSRRLDIEQPGVVTEQELRASYGAARTAFDATKITVKIGESSIDSYVDKTYPRDAVCAAIEAGIHATVSSLWGLSSNKTEYEQPAQVPVTEIRRLLALAWDRDSFKDADADVLGVVERWLGARPEASK